MALVTASECAALIPGLSATGINSDTIAQAEALIATFCGYSALLGVASMESASRTFYRDGSDVVLRQGVSVLKLGVFPVSSITTLHDDQDGDLSYDAADLVDSSDYTLDTARGEVLFLPQGDHTPSRTGLRRFKVVATVGYSAAEDDLKRQIAETVRHLMQRHKVAGLKSINTETGSTAYEDTATLIPAAVQAALWRRYVLPGVLGVN